MLAAFIIKADGVSNLAQDYNAQQTVQQPGDIKWHYLSHKTFTADIMHFRISKHWAWQIKPS
jgi:hypothetical protein